MKTEKNESKRINLQVKDPNALKKWIFKRINVISDADPQTLAPYILVLLRKAAPPSELKASIIAQLEVFLKTHTTDFVNELFECIENEEYLQQEEYNPVHSAINVISNPSEQPCSPNLHPVIGSTVTEISHMVPPSQDLHPISSNPRSVSDASAAAIKSVVTSHSREREKPTKRSSSHSRSRRVKNHSSSSSSRSRSPELASTVTVAESSYRKNRSRELLSRRDGSDIRSRLGNGGNSGHRGSNSGYRKRYPHRCRDYDTKGFCLKGDKCLYIHGSDALVMATPGSIPSITAALQLLTNAGANTNISPPTFSIPPPSGPINGTHSSQEYNVGPPSLPPDWSLPVYHPSPITSASRTTTNTNLISVVTTSPTPNSPQQNAVPPGYEPTFCEPPRDTTPPEVATVRDTIVGISSSDLRTRGMVSFNRQRYSPTRSTHSSRYQPYHNNGSHRRGRPYGRFYDDQGFRGGGRPRYPQHCIRVSNIPAGKDNVGDIHNCFKEFGNIIKVEMMHNQPNTALVYFSHEHEVERAYRHTGIFLGSPLIEVKMHHTQNTNKPRFYHQSKHYDGFPKEELVDSGSGGEESMDTEENQRHRENQPAAYRSTFSRERKTSDSSRGSRNTIAIFGHEDRRKIEKDLALKERQEQIALLDKAKEEHQRYLIKSLTSFIQKLLDKHDNLKTTDADSAVLKKQLYANVVESSRYLEQVENGQCSTEELFKHIPEHMTKIAQRFSVPLSKPPPIGGLESSPNNAPAADKKALLKLDTRPSVVYVTGLLSDKADEEEQGFCSLLAHSNMPITDHRLYEVEGNQIVLAIKFSTREYAEQAVRGIKRYRGRDVTLSFIPPLTIQGNPFQSDLKTSNPPLVSQESIESKDETNTEANYMLFRRNNSLGEPVTMVVELSEDENMGEFDNEEESNWVTK